MKHIHKTKQNHYAGVWRWHFYIGLLLAPFLLILAITGGIYLFKGEIESVIYSDYYEVEPGETVHPPSHLTEAALAEIPAGEVVRYRPGDTASRSAEVGISTEEGEVYTVFVDPYQSEVLGMINDENRVMNTIEDLHGELMAGTLGDRLVELAASWTLLLIASGLYLWWPRKKPSIYGTLIPRKTTSKKQLIRDIHVVPAFWISGGLVLFLVTGLLWTGFWGNGVQHVATSTGVGYPPSIWVGDPPESGKQAEDVADVSWAAENMPVADSVPLEAYEQLSIDTVVQTAKQENVQTAYDIFYPGDTTGVYTVSAFPDRAQDEVTMHIDQYSGTILADYRWEDYQWAGKAMALGITIHKGFQFGLINQLAGLALCIGLIGMIVSGIWLWRKRKPDNHIGAPKGRIGKGFWLLVIVFGVLFPLVGVSLILIFLIDRFLIQKNQRLSRYFNV